METQLPMFQPEVKLEFVRRYCPPKDGWMVSVDIDASEEGRTGGERTTEEARRVQRQMRADGERVRREFKRLEVTVGKRAEWFERRALPPIIGDRDVVAFHAADKICLIAEVEGSSSGQPEQKLYKAIGQLVMAASSAELPGWRRALVLVVHGEKIAVLLSRAEAIKQLGISALVLAKTPTDDRWSFRDERLPHYPKN